MADDPPSTKRERPLAVSETLSGANTMLASADNVASEAITSVIASDGRRYKLGALLGQGGMGEVVLAYDEQLGREVAIKRIRAAAPSAEQLGRFLREARVQGRLQHPAIVPVHDLATDEGGKPYFVMKRLAGTTMADLIDIMRAEPDNDETPMIRRRLLRAFVDVCLAIELAHTQGIIHRDLKPANIMLGDFGEVYVLDWGVARALGEADAPTLDPEAPERPPSGPQAGLELDSGETRHGTVLGTPAYMAPEQLTGDRAGPAADIYALGCILFEIASGQVLHDKRRSISNLLKPIDARPSRLRNDAAPELDQLCVRATKLHPEQRFSTARALGEAVQAHLDGDRDIAVRRELAAHHLATARAALERPATDATSRRDAIAAAGRALALDPSSAEAAALVSRLMLEPPPTPPAEVEAALARKDVESAREQGRLAALSQLGYLAFVPFVLWTGAKQPALLVAFAVLAIASALQIFWMSRGSAISQASLYVSAVINATLIAVVTRLVGPFLVAPTLVITTLIAFSAHPSFGRIRLMAVILGAGVVVPWILELVGVLPETFRFVNGELHLISPALRFSSVPVQLALGLLLVLLIGVVALLTRVLAVRQRQAAQQLEMHAWQLRQLLPKDDR